MSTSIDFAELDKQEATLRIKFFCEFRFADKEAFCKIANTLHFFRMFDPNDTQKDIERDHNVEKPRQRTHFYCSFASNVEFIIRGVFCGVLNFVRSMKSALRSVAPQGIFEFVVHVTVMKVVTTLLKNVILMHEM